MNSKYMILKTLLLSIFMAFTAVSYAGMMSDLFNTKYDPYYGRLATQSPGCYRECINKLDNCDCACNVDQCKCVRSVNTYEKRTANAPFQPMSELYFSIFD